MVEIHLQHCCVVEKGVYYKEILIDVCKRLKVNFNSESEVGVIERNLLMKILSDALDKMSQQDIKELALEFGLVNLKTFNREAMLAAIQYIFNSGGFRSYQITVMLANVILKALIGRGLTIAANATLVRIVSLLAGPIGWAITAAWTLVDIGGTAYRVTIPAVIQIAVLRSKINNNIKVDDIIF